MKPSTRLKKMLEHMTLDVSERAYRCQICNATVPVVPMPMEAEAWITAANARCLGHLVEHFIEEERAKK